MTFTCRIVDNENRVLVDLTGKNSVFCIDRAVGFDSAVSDPGKVAMTLNLFSSYGAAERMSEIEKISECLDNARRAIGQNRDDLLIWLELWDNYEYPKRSLIYEGHLSFSGSSVSSLHQGKGSGTTFALNIVRHEYWESTQPVYIEFNYESAGKPIPLQPLGTAPGRIASTLFSTTGVGDADGLWSSTKIHAGIREKYNGTESYENSRKRHNTGWKTLANSNTVYNLEQFATYTDFSNSQPAKLPDYYGMYRIFGLVLLNQNFTLGKTFVNMTVAPGGTHAEDVAGGETWLYGDSSQYTEHLVDYGIFSIPKSGNALFYLQGIHVEGSNKQAALLYSWMVPANRHFQDMNPGFWGAHAATPTAYAVTSSGESFSQSFKTTHTDDLITPPGTPGFLLEDVFWDYPHEGGALFCTDLSKGRNTVNSSTGLLVPPGGVGNLVDSITRRGRMHVYPRWKMYRTRPV